MGYMGVSQNLWYLFGGPYSKDYSILGSTLGYLNFGETTIMGTTIRIHSFLS